MGWEFWWTTNQNTWVLQTRSGSIDWQLNIISIDSILSSFYLTLRHNFTSRGDIRVPTEELHLAWALMLDIHSIRPELHWLVMGVSIRWQWVRCTNRINFPPWDIKCTEVWSSSFKLDRCIINFLRRTEFGPDNCFPILSYPRTFEESFQKL